MPSRSFVQVPGEGFRMRVTTSKEMLDRSPQTHGLMLRYTLALVTQIAQITSCNRLHEVQQRRARWLLQTHDRVDSDSFPLKQEFLAQMLGGTRGDCLSSWWHSSGLKRLDASPLVGRVPSTGSRSTGRF